MLSHSRVGIGRAIGLLAALCAVATAACGNALGPVACTQEQLPAITVIVKDSVTGAPPTNSAVQAVAIDGAYADTARASAASIAQGSTLGLAYERPGTYRVEVDADGYLPWATDNVQVTKGTCHVISSGVTARLQKP